MRRDLPAGRGKLRGLPAVTQHGSIGTCSRVPFQSIAPAQALLQCLRAVGWRPRRPRHRCRHLPAGSRGFCRGSVSPAAPRAAPVWSCPLDILAPLRPDTGAPGLATSLSLWGGRSWPSHCLPPDLLLLHHGGQLPEGREQLPSLPTTPGGPPGWAPLSTPRCKERGLSGARVQGSRAGQPGHLPPALCSGPSAARAQTLGRKDCKTAKEGKQRGWSVSGCSGEPQSAAGSSPAGAARGRVMVRAVSRADPRQGPVPGIWAVLPEG